MKRILVIGATGVLGSATSKHFLKLGFPVTCFARNKAKASELEKAGARLVIGDLAKHADLENACKDVDVVVTAAHAMFGKGKNSSMNIDNKAHKALIDAAIKGNVSHFIYTSIHGVSPHHPVDLFRNKFSVEQYLVKSGLTYTIVRLPAFMEWHVHALLGKAIIEKNKATILGDGENPINFIAVDDVVQALNVIVENRDYLNRTINISGPENASRNEIAAAYAKKLNVIPNVRHVPVGVLRILSKLIKPLHPGIARVMNLSVYTNASDETMDPKESIRQFGLRPTTIYEFIEKAISAGCLRKSF